ncbi:MAG: ComF family protein [Flavobacteriales bacterium]|nr:ComF family protein [Flavobacteriales bacterium]
MNIPIFTDLLSLFYPRICGGCDTHLMKHEQNLCLSCTHGLPKTYFWDYKINPIEQLFWGRLSVNSACAFLHFEKEGTVQQLMHRFKYQGKTGVGTELASMFAHILKEKKWFADVDVVVPIPLHPSKEQRRGYNQSRFIANGMAEVFDVPVWSNALQKIVASDSQTRKTRFERAENVEQVFTTTPNRFSGKVVLLVDDIVTTGATLEAAGKLIFANGATRLYIATLACA